MHTKKRDCTIAVPHIRLWYCLYIQTTTLKPTPYAHMRALCAYIIYIPMGILCCNVLDVCEFTRFDVPKQSAKDAFMSVSHPHRVQQRGRNRAVNRHKSDARLRSPHRKQSVIYVGVPIGVG